MDYNIFEVKGIEKVLYNTKTVALVCRNAFTPTKTVFVTTKDNEFQAGVGFNKKGTKLEPHIHRTIRPFLINHRQELIYVDFGKIRVDLYDNKFNKITSKILKERDWILTINCGHGITYLKDSKLQMFLNGPYLDVLRSKITKNY